MQEDVLKEAYEKKKSNGCRGKLYIGDSREINIFKILKSNSIEKVQFIIFHPPYWDIIKFSDKENDLSNSKTVKEFLSSFGKVIDNTTKYLEKNRYCSIVIGDKYENSQIIPLGFHCMNLFLERNFLLKATIVKILRKQKEKKSKKESISIL